MGEYWDRLPERVKEHLELLVEPAGLKDTADADEILARAWLEKHDAFEFHTADRGMKGVDSFSKDETTGALAMTFSGSIVSIGPATEEGRDVAYASIGARKDVPKMSVKQVSRLAEDAAVGAVIRFDEGPVQQTSPVYAMAMFDAVSDATKESAALVELTQVLTERFVDINKETLHGG